MFRGHKSRQKVLSALKNKDLQLALSRAANHHFQKFKATQAQINWPQLKEKAQRIREKNLNQLPELIRQFTSEATQSGAHIYWAEDADQANKIIEEIIKQKQAKLIVKSKSMVTEEIGLNDYLQKKGLTVIETDLGEWLIQLAGDRPSHLTAPALHLTKEKMAELLKKKFQVDIPPKPENLVRFARQQLRPIFYQAEIGISGANLAVAETGSLVILSNEGNARLVTSLPSVHIALITIEKFVATLEEAMTLVKALVVPSSGNKITTYVSFITGPSRTTDIEKQVVFGAHGPQEVHIVILDNGRSSALENEQLKKALSCLKCGGCLLVCPVFQQVGGHVYGGPVYPGGIGTILTTITRSPKEAKLGVNLCADCKRCEDFCPVNIPTGDLLVSIKNQLPPSGAEFFLSRLFRHFSLLKIGASLGSRVPKFLRKIPSSLFAQNRWLKDKKIPLPSPSAKFPLPQEPSKPTVLLFQGCLIRFFFPSIAQAASEVLAYFNWEVISPPHQACCGAPSLHLGRKEDFLALAKKNIALISDFQPAVIITLCPTGNSFLKKKYPEFFPEFKPWAERVRDFSDFLASFDPPFPIDQDKQKIFYHYSCHFLYDLGLKEKPLELLKKWRYDPILENEPYTCCGFAGAFSLRNPELSTQLWNKKKTKLEASNLHLVATDCPGCIWQFQSYLNNENDNYQVFHTAELIAKSLTTNILNKENTVPDQKINL